MAVMFSVIELLIAFCYSYSKTAILDSIVLFSRILLAKTTQSLFLRVILAALAFILHSSCKLFSVLCGVPR